jgi:hypothetical protein
VGLAIVLVALGEVLLPTSGIGGLAGRVALWLAYPLLLYLTGFLNEEERRAAARVLSPSAVRTAFASLRTAAAGAGSSQPEEPTAEEPKEERGEVAARWPRLTGEALEAEQRDEDAIR